MTFALVLGGGGTVGVAWEVGVLAALADAGIQPSDAKVIVGSSGDRWSARTSDKAARSSAWRPNSEGRATTAPAGPPPPTSRA